MKVLIACEYSGIVRDAFTAKGHNAWSCDILPTENQGNHIQDDVLKHLDKGWDLMIAHPPCTYLAVSGARWLYNKDGSRNTDRWIKKNNALNFVRDLMNTNIKKIAIENPISIISSEIRKPEQIIRPYQFGDNSTKLTCLWLKNLPKLKYTNIIEPTKHITKNGKIYDKWWFDTCLISNLEERAKVRSKTFLGIAKAMADQWG